MPDSNLFGRVETPVSLKERAYTSIKDAILSLHLEPGSPIVETTLAEQLGISKTPVRDALQELEREGFVARVLFKGTYVTDVTMKDVREVFELRAVLEGLAAHLATPSFGDKELDEICAHLMAAEDALADGDLLLCSQHGQILHRAIIYKADNARLVPIIQNLDDHVQRFRGLSDRISGRLHKSVREHRRVLAALYDRNPVAAEQAMRDHLFSVLHDLQASAEPPAEPLAHLPDRPVTDAKL
jgi:DNA-binding GntR family transcriptional regulator